MKSPIRLNRIEYDPSKVHVYYTSGFFYAKEKDRMIEFVFTSKNCLGVRTIHHFVETDGKDMLVDTTTKSEYLKGVSG